MSHLALLAVAPLWGAEPSAPEPAALPPEQLQAVAEDPGVISRRELRRFRPSPGRLPANPRGQTDFTAYTLEWGEVKLGVASITVGVLPHTQVGTSVPLDVLGVPNVHAKVHATERGPFDIAATVDHWAVPRADFDASYTSVGGVTSVQVTGPWSVHLGGAWSRAEVEGVVDMATLPQLAWFLDAGDDGGAGTGGELISAETVSVRAATDLRLNRRDSIIVQGEAIVWARVRKDDSVPTPEVLGLEEVLTHDGAVPLADAGSASIAWQFAWEHVELRLGVGVSSVPYAWLLQSTELCYRFGGPTHRREARQRTTWRRNRTDLVRAEREAATADPA